MPQKKMVTWAVWLVPTLEEVPLDFPMICLFGAYWEMFLSMDPILFKQMGCLQEKEKKIKITNLTNPLPK